MTEAIIISLDDLLKKMGTKEGLTIAEKLQMAEMLTAQANQEKEDAFEENIEKIKNLIAELSLTTDEVVKALMKPAKKIVEWNGNVRMEGERGKHPTWVDDFKKLGKDECMKFVVNNEPKGIAFVNNLFADKKQG